LAELFSTQGWNTPYIKPLNHCDGSKIDYNKHCKLQFGTYIQMHVQHNKSLLYSQISSLAPHGQCTRQLLSGKQVIRNNWAILPMPAEEISTIHRLAAACKK